MQKQHLEVVIISSKRSVCCKRPAETWGEGQPVYKRPRRNSSVCPMEWEASLPPESSRCSYSNTDVFVNSSLSHPTAQPQRMHQPKEAPCRTAYDPFDFTSDELNPTYEWLRNSSSARECGADVIPLLRSTLSPFPLGLRLNKLEAMVWRKHKIHLLQLSLERGYRGSLQFLQAVPGIILKFQRKRASRCLVKLDPAGGKASL
ncbi:uncharacterized protein PHA67_018853 [Liasis olivaceus]